MRRKTYVALSILCIFIVVTPVMAFSFGFDLASAEGRVTNSSGQSLQGVTVKLIAGSSTMDTDSTDSSGYYEVTYPEYISSQILVTLKFQKTGYYTKTKSVYLYPGSVTTKNVALTPIPPPDTTPPARVTGLEGEPESHTRIHVSWDANSESDLDHYVLYRNGVFHRNLDKLYVDYFDGSLTPDMLYYYRVSAVDTSGNEGLRSDQISVRTFEDPGPVEWHALVVAGGLDQRFSDDASLFHNMLIDHYGFTADDIQFVAPGFPVDPDTEIPIVTDAVTSRESVEAQIDIIAGRADRNDRVLIWWTGHGYGSPYPETFSCPYSYHDFNELALTSDELATWLNRIQCEFMYIMLGPCYSGRFIDNLEADNRIILTSCGPEETGDAGAHSTWPWGTLHSLDPDLDAAVADTNGDSKVDFNELYVYCCNFLILEGVTDQNPILWKSSLICSYDDHYIGSYS